MDCRLRKMAPALSDILRLTSSFLVLLLLMFCMGAINLEAQDASPAPDEGTNIYIIWFRWVDSLMFRGRHIQAGVFLSAIWNCAMIQNYLQSQMLTIKLFAIAHFLGERATLLPCIFLHLPLHAFVFILNLRYEGFWWG